MHYHLITVRVIVPQLALFINVATNAVAPNFLWLLVTLGWDGVG